MQSSRVQNIFFFSVLFIVSLLFLYLLKPFFFPIFWAAVIAGIFKPLFRLLDKKLHRPSLSSAVVLIVVILVIIFPGGMMGSLLFTESTQVYDSFSSKNREDIEKKISRMTSEIENHPFFLKMHLDKNVLTEKFSDMVKSISTFIFASLKNLTQNSIAFIAQFAVMLYTLFFFIRDGEKFINKAINFFPLGHDREKILYERFVATTRATLKVTLMIGGLQGFLGGVLFWFTGVEGALIWGVVMVLTAIIPVVGCSIIWAPIGVILLLTGYVWEGVVILVFGVLVISLVDNFLRPVLLGRDTQMHPLLIFLSTLGGISLFGFSGFVFGPVITSLFLAIWGMYDQLYRDRLS
jgi:predicted PurR-regulated permease PerM